MIKVISNPYLKEIRFQEWDDIKNDWQDLPEDIPSKLLGTDIKNGVLPFIASKIIDRIIEEYGPDPDDIELVFEGTSDEYREFQSACFEKGVKLSESSRYLENARVITDDIKKIFEEVRILAYSSIQGESQSFLQKEIQRFLEASGDEIPICILGNYSSGKSTFVNALLGYELLPSGDRPTSARICRIKKSKLSDSALIKFCFDGTNYTISFSSDRFRIIPTTLRGDLEQKIMDAIDGNYDNDIRKQVHDILCFLNEYANKDSSDAIGDLIEIEFPIDESNVISKSNFVIFDTPGSNSFSNEKHSVVLKHAMEKMSNGLPVFITASDAIDSLDNVKLYEDFRNADNLDERFTMIIMNKADKAGLNKIGHTKSDKVRIMDYAIPQKPCSGVYYVSSIMGLGAKNKGQFDDEDYAEVFEDNVDKYSNPANRRYRQLYQYNVLPEQIDARLVEDAEQQPDMIYANSGLYTIEEAIDEFGRKYSCYDKCQRSYVIISKIIQSAYEKIEEELRTREDKKEKVRNSLDRETKALIQKVQGECDDWKKKYPDSYEESIGSKLEALSDRYALPIENLEELQNDIHDEKAEELGLNKIKKRRWEIVKKTANDILNIKNNFREIIEIQTEAQQKKEEVGKVASSLFLEKISNEFDYNSCEVWNNLESYSESFLIEESQEFRDRLCQIVTDNEGVPDDKKKKLNTIILNFEAPLFRKSLGNIFTSDRFRRKISKPYQFKEAKVQSIFQMEMNNHIQNSYRRIKEIHQDNFEEWLEKLENTISENMVDLNRNLTMWSQEIKELNKKLEDAKRIKEELEDCHDRIEALIGWNTI